MRALSGAGPGQQVSFELIDEDEAISMGLMGTPITLSQHAPSIAGAVATPSVAGDVSVAGSDVGNAMQWEEESVLSDGAERAHLNAELQGQLAQINTAIDAQERTVAEVKRKIDTAINEFIKVLISVRVMTFSVLMKMFRINGWRNS